MADRKRSFRRVCWTGLSLLLLQGCKKEGVIDPAGPITEAELIILIDSLAIMLAIVIPTIIATIAFAWWFRASNKKARYLPDWTYSGRVELLVWSVPTLVILFLGGITWIGSHDLDPARPIPSQNKPLEVQVVALDWKWLFIYPDQNIASINRLVIPAGTPLHLRITASSVLNVFFIPQLGSQIYAMNGMAAELNLKADKPGEYDGLAAHFNGDGFPDMRFTVQAMPEAQFKAWANTTHVSGPVLDNDAYRGLLKQTQNVTPYTYSSVENGLFDAIVMQKLPSGEGPQIKRPGKED